MRLITPSGLLLAAGLFLAGPAQAQLAGVVNEDGLISVSVDANGNNDSFGGVLEVDKPNAGATVRAAYMAAASNFDYVITNTDIALAGTPITWTQSVFNNAGTFSPTFFNNVFADVTSIVAPIVDAAAPGIIPIPVTEGINTGVIDGTVLAVIFDDPAVTQSSGVILLFGGQDTTGDQFTISLAAPLDLTDPGATADMGLGISFGFQGTSGTAMVSEIDVNGTRMTSSAGGEDDGGPFNGGLITVGGIGDSNANPADPFAGSSSFDTDDELYDLLPFVSTGDTEITVDTFNPSDDDNIFFGYFVTSVPISVADETLFLTPTSATQSVTCEHTVTATVEDATTNTPIAGRTVNFTVVSGPNAGATGSGVTDAAGQTSFTYMGSNVAGLDSIQADMINSDGDPVTSNTATVDWDGGIGMRYCSPNSINSTGKAATIIVQGSLFAADDDLDLHVKNVPNGQTGYFVWSINPDMIDLITPGISDGFLCLGTGKGRFCGCNGHQGSILTHVNESAWLLDIDTTNMPKSTPPRSQAITAGLTGYFQYWFRDPAGPAGNNFSDAVSLTWQ